MAATHQRARTELIEALAGTSLYVRLAHEHDQWYAEATDFQIVGIGDSRAEATEAMLLSLEKYLRTARKHGQSPEQARRSPGLAATLRVRALVMVGKLAPQSRRPAVRITVPAR